MEAREHLFDINLKKLHIPVCSVVVGSGEFPRFSQLVDLYHPGYDTIHI